MLVTYSFYGDIMAKTKMTSCKGQRRTPAAKKTTVVYPMMPRGYTAAQREQLRIFEKELLKGKKVVIG